MSCSSDCEITHYFPLCAPNNIKSISFGQGGRQTWSPWCVTRAGGVHCQWGRRGGNEAEVLEETMDRLRTWSGNYQKHDGWTRCAKDRSGPLGDLEECRVACRVWHVHQTVSACTRWRQEECVEKGVVPEHRGAWGPCWSFLTVISGSPLSLAQQRHRIGVFERPVWPQNGVGGEDERQRGLAGLFTSVDGTEEPDWGQPKGNQRGGV